MANFKPIAFASAGWDKDINSNFDNVVHDTGWQPFNFVAPATGSLQYKILNSILYFNGSFRTGIVGDAELGKFPSQIAGKNFVGTDTNNGTSVYMGIKNDSTFAATVVSATNRISLDSVAIYVGDIIDLGG